MSEIRLYDIEQSAIDDLRNRLNDLISEEKIADPDSVDNDYHNELCEMVFEISDSNVPIYNGDILQLAADNYDLALNEPELGPAFDGSPTPINIIAANIFEHIENRLWEYVRDEMESDDKLKWYKFEYNETDIYYYELSVYVASRGIFASNPRWLVAEPYDADNIPMYQSFWNTFNDIVEDAVSKGMKHIEIVWYPDPRPIIGCELPPK